MTYSILDSVNCDGIACPASFHIMHLEPPGRYFVSGEFGDCSDIPAGNS